VARSADESDEDTPLKAGSASRDSFDLMVHTRKLDMFEFPFKFVKN
jgi:hypothetical protein